MRVFITAPVTSIGSGLLTVRDVLNSLAVRVLATLPKTPRAKHQLPDEEGPLAVWHWIEDNGAIVFPLIGFFIAALIFIAVRRGAVNQEALNEERRKQKDQIIRLMRARLSLTADQTAHELRVDRYHAAALLEELEKEGTLTQGRIAGGVSSYRLKGF